MLFWKKNNKLSPEKKVVMAFGTFDLLHAGHQNYLRQAKENGDFLIVVLARDNTIRSVKGKSPANNEKQRVKNLRQTGWADHIELGNRQDKYKIILKHRPQVIALGYDQFVFTQALPKILIDNGLNTEIIRTTPYYPQVYKSSLLREKKETTEQSHAGIQPVKPTANYN
jgi:FAD synthetase